MQKTDKVSAMIALFLISVAIISVVSFACAKANEYNLGDDIIECSEYWGEYYGVCPELIQAVICKESSGQYTAQSGDCIGLMQVNQYYHPAPNGENLWSTDTNIHVGTEYLATLIAEGKGIVWALDRYNGQDADSNKANGITSKYSKWIIEKTQELLEEHGKEPLTLEALGAPKYFVDTVEASTPNDTEEDTDMSNITAIISDVSKACNELLGITNAEEYFSLSIMVSRGEARVHVMANEDGELGIEELAHILGVGWAEKQREYDDGTYPYERYFEYEGVYFFEIRKEL